MFTAALDAPSGAPWNTQATAPSMIRPARKPPFIALGAGAALLIAVLVISARHCTGNASTSAATSSAAVQPHAAPPTASPDPAAQATSVANARAPAAPSPSVPPPASDSASFDPKALTTLPLSFQRGRADFAVEDAAAFDSIIKSLARNLEDNPTARLEIGGHTSSEGAPSVNRALGRERALLVQTYLVEHAISRERTTIVNYSASKPVASTTNAEANRRVTLRILH